MRKRILTTSQIKKKIKIVKKAKPLTSISALADIYHAFVLRRYRRFKDDLKDNPDELNKGRIKYCHERVRYYVKELDKLVNIARRIRDLERKAARKKGAAVTNKIKKQAEEAENVCRLYARDIKRLK